MACVASPGSLQSFGAAIAKTKHYQRLSTCADQNSTRVAVHQSVPAETSRSAAADYADNPTISTHTHRKSAFREKCRQSAEAKSQEESFKKKNVHFDQNTEKRCFF